MTLVDANLLIYATDRSSSHHIAALRWLDGQINEVARVGLPWSSLLAFLRITTHRRAISRPFTIQEAWEQVERWLAHPNVWVPLPAEHHQEILSRMLRAGISADLVPDAHLAALAIEHGLTLCSADRDFARFPGLKWKNPLDETGI